MSEKTNCYGYYESPIGLVEAGVTGAMVTSLRFVEERRASFQAHPMVQEVFRQMKEYFEGARRAFDLPLRLEGTAFQRDVWQELIKIPFGRTMAYSDLADALEKPQAVRAVGAANGQNPLAIVVPCHRVIGRDGGLVGYGGGLWRKEWLLRHEGVLLL